jgi:subtilase family serine protease
MPASQGLAVNELASTPFNVAVGGTEFNDTASPSTYWNASNNAQLASAKGYIPEVAWNESSYAAGGSDNNLYAGGGGSSAIWPRPSWQTGSGVPSGSMRLTPDVSLTASRHDGYAIELNGGLYMMGGTSASAPSFAGLMAIVNQYTHSANGNPAARLYSLAASVPSVYHDVTAGSNTVPCEGGSPGCSAPLPASNVGTMSGYSAGAGYDMATGLGSVDANALVTNWAIAANIVSLSPNPMTGSPASQNLTINGAGFVVGNGLVVTVGNVTYRGAAVTLVSSSQLVVSIDAGITAQSLSVSVTVPNGTTTNSVALIVTAPAEPPAVSTLSPTQIAPSNSVQTLTVIGSGFVSGSGLKVTVGGTAYSGSQITSVSHTQLAVSVNVGASCQLLPVQVTNPNGQASNSIKLPVSATPAAVADVQAIVNQSLGISPPASDLNQDGTVDVVDVQIAIADVLSFRCT